MANIHLNIIKLLKYVYSFVCVDNVCRGTVSSISVEFYTYHNSLREDALK